MSGTEVTYKVSLSRLPVSDRSTFSFADIERVRTFLPNLEYKRRYSQLTTPTKNKTNVKALRTPVFTPTPRLTLTPASAIRTSASMATTVRAEDRSSPLLTGQHGNNTLDPSLDLMGGIEVDSTHLEVDTERSTTGVLSPSAIRRLALQTPNPPLDKEQPIKTELLFDSDLLDVNGTPARVLNFDDEGDKVVDVREHLVVDTAILDEFVASQETDEGEYGLAAAFDIESSDSPPPSDLVSW
jgi:hypothetical protein